MGGFPAGVVAVTPPGATHDDIYVLNSQDSTVSVIDTDTNQVVATIPVAEAPVTAAVSPDGSLAYVGGRDSMTVIDTTTRTAVLTTRTDATPDFQATIVAVSSDGSQIYVSDPTKVYDLTNPSAVEYNDTVSVISFVTGRRPEPTRRDRRPDPSRRSGIWRSQDDLDSHRRRQRRGKRHHDATGQRQRHGDAQRRRHLYRHLHSERAGPSRCLRWHGPGRRTPSSSPSATVRRVDSETVTVPIDPAEVAVTDTFDSGPGLNFVQGMTVAPNGDVYVTYLTPDSLINTQEWTLTVFNSTTQTPVDEQRLYGRQRWRQSVRRGCGRRQQWPDLRRQPDHRHGGCVQRRRNAGGS